MGYIGANAINNMGVGDEGTDNESTKSECRVGWMLPKGGNHV